MEKDSMEEDNLDFCVLKDLNFMMINHNIPGPGFDDSIFTEQLPGCSCGSEPNTTASKACTLLSCPCKKGFPSAYTTCGLLAALDPMSSCMSPIYECNDACTCGERCGNRVVQHGPHVSMKVIRTGSKGYGIEAQQHIAQGTFVCEYVGEILTEDTARLRFTQQRTTDSNYILVLREHLYRGDVIHTYIDPRYMGNIGRFINHSCEPNLVMVPVRVDSTVPHAALFALRDIQCGEELCYDYSGDLSQQVGTASETVGTAGKSAGTACETAGTAGESAGIDGETVGKTVGTAGETAGTANETGATAGQSGRTVCLCGTEMCKGFLPVDCSLGK